MTEVRREYAIPVANWAAFEKRMAHLIRRAEKLGAPPVGYERLGERFIETPAPPPDVLGGPIEWGDEPPSVRRKVVDVRVFGEAPKLPGGWRSVAVIEPVNGSEKNFVFSLDDDFEFDAEEFRAVPMTRCDHCRKAIGNRSKLVVVGKPDGELAVVGLTCLKDFVGHNTPEYLAAYSAILVALDEMGGFEDGDWGGGGGGDSYVGIESLLAVAAAIIRVEGWVPRSSATFSGPLPTADLVSNYIFPPVLKGRDAAREREWRESVRPNDTDRELASEAREWALTATGDRGYNEFLANLEVLAESDYVHVRKFGLATALIPSFTREKAREFERRKAAAESEWVGEIGKREIFDLTLTKIVVTEGMYGTTYITKFVDLDGNRVTWFASAKAGYWVEPNGEPVSARAKTWDATFVAAEIGDTFTVRATVKRHETWEEIKETHITRAVLIGPPLREEVTDG
jgi:hypothetical protein